MKRFTACLIGTIMMTASVFAGDYNMDEDWWAYDTMVEAYDSGYIEKDEAAGDYATRQGAFAALVRMLDISDENHKQINDFEDSKDIKNVYYENLKTAYSSGLINGYEDNTIRPENNIKRAEWASVIANIIENADKYENVKEFEVQENSCDFSDTKDSWADGYIRECCEAGILNGYDDGTFRPDNYITNAEIMTSINRLTEKEEDIQLSDDTQKAYELYAAANEIAEQYSSYTTAIDVKISMQGEGMTDMNTAMTGEISCKKDDDEFEMSGQLKTSVLGMDTAMGIYYKDGYMYQNVTSGLMGEMKVKSAQNVEEVMGQTAVMQKIEKSAVISGEYEQLSDGRSRISLDFDVSKLTDGIESMGVPAMSDVKMDGNAAYEAIVEADGSIKESSVVMISSIEAEGAEASFVYDVKSSLKDINCAEVTFPDDLDEYEDMDVYLDDDE